jgi:arylsulfatase A-like enzyme
VRPLMAMLIWASLAASVSFSAESRPNVVFFLVDDMGWADLGCFGSQTYETPHADKLASSGLRFTQAYAACGVCSPTRHSIMSGKYPGRSGCTQFGMHMAPSEETLAESMKKGGYATYFLGKWHLGDKPGMKPQDQGFDVNIGGGRAGQPGSYFYPYKGRFKQPAESLKNGMKGEYLTDRLGDEAVKLLNNHDRSKPFLLYLAFYSVHTPIMAKKEDRDHFSKKIAAKSFKGGAYKVEGGKKMKQHQDSPAFSAMVKAVDDNVGKVLAKLKKMSLQDNTIVFFMSDNGGAAYYKNATSNLPLRGAKGWYYEGGIREPMIVSWPGKIKRGTSDAPVISTDFYPTILDLCGLKLLPEQHKDGTSLKDHLLSNKPLKPRSLFWHYPHNHGSGSKAAAAIRSEDYKLIEWMAGDKRVELYDVVKDIGESRDLSKAMPEKTKLMRRDLHAWQKEVNAKMIKKSNRR